MGINRNVCINSGMAFAAVLEDRHNLEPRHHVWESRPFNSAFSSLPLLQGRERRLGYASCNFLSPCRPLVFKIKAFYLCGCLALLVLAIQSHLYVSREARYGSRKLVVFYYWQLEFGMSALGGKSSHFCR